MVFLIVSISMSNKTTTNTQVFPNTLFIKFMKKRGGCIGWAIHPPGKLNPGSLVNQVLNISSES